jgi:hypothetical protein
VIAAETATDSSLKQASAPMLRSIAATLSRGERATAFTLGT